MCHLRSFLLDGLGIRLKSLHEIIRKGVRRYVLHTFLHLIEDTNRDIAW